MCGYLVVVKDANSGYLASIFVRWNQGRMMINTHELTKGRNKLIVFWTYNT